MIIRINLLGAQKLKVGWRKHPFVSGTITLGLILLLTVAFFRFIRLLHERSTVPQQTASEVVETPPPSAMDTLSMPPSAAVMDTSTVTSPSQMDTLSVHAPTIATDTSSVTSPSVSVVRMVQETLPPFVWFSSLRSDVKGDYTIEGIAFSSHRAHEFLGRLSQLSALCEMPEAMSIQEDSQGRKIFRFTICGSVREKPYSPSRHPVTMSGEDLSRLTDLMLTEGRNRQIRFLGAPTWEEMSVEGGLGKRGTFLATGRYRQVVAWLQELEHLYGGSCLTSFSITPGGEEGQGDTVILSATVAVIVK